MKKIRMC